MYETILTDNGYIRIDVDSIMYMITKSEMRVPGKGKQKRRFKKIMYATILIEKWIYFNRHRFYYVYDIILYMRQF